MEQEIISQYKASLKMLLDVINRCPGNLWEDDKYNNACWHIVYHTLFYTSLYLSESPAKFTPWIKHKENYNYLGDTASDGTPVIIENIYSRSEMIEYLETISKECENLTMKNLGNERSGFEWLPMSKTGLHIYNIRHIQHHTGQLTERLHQSGISGIKWESSWIG